MIIIILTLVIGAVIGFSAGMFGIGGALLATPLLRLALHLPEVLAVATPLPAAIPAAVSGSFVYHQQKLIRFDVAWRVLVVSIPFSQAGVFLTRRTPGPLLMMITGVVLLYSAWVFIARGWKLTKEVAIVEKEGGEIRRSPLMYPAGALAGFLSGFLAIGGGIILVPAFVRILRLPTKTALATSLFCVAALAIPGTVTHSFEGNIDWPVALTLCAAVIPCSYFGARVASGLRSVTLERLYGVVMMAFAIFFTIENFLELTGK